MTPATAVRSPFNPDGRLVFNRLEHRYYLAPGRELTSVTKDLEIAFSGTLGEEYWTEESRQRGSAIHEAILFYAQNDLDKNTLHPIIRPYWEGAEQMFRDEQPEILHAEEPVFDEFIGYAGMFDLLCRLRGFRRASAPNVIDLLDAKTGLVPWTIGMQTAAYKRAIQKVFPHDVIRRWAWNLRADGTYTLDEIKAPRWPDYRLHEAQFLAAHTVAQLKREHMR